MSWLMPVVDEKGKVLFRDTGEIYVYNEAKELRQQPNIPMQPNLGTNTEDPELVELQTDDEASDSNKGKWSHDAILLLLTLYEEHLPEFQSARKSNRTAWNVITKCMNAKGHLVSSEQCDVKFRNLKKTYKRIKDNNRQTETGSITWPYFYKFDSLFGNNADTVPTALGNIVGYTSNSPSTSRSSPVSEESRAATPTPSGRSKKRPHSADLNDEPIWMKNYRKEAAERHAEKMGLLKQLIDVLKEK